MRCMNNMQANICLLAVTLCWSCEIVLLALVPKEVNPFATNCTTSLIAALLLGACFYRRIVATFKRDGFVLARRIALLGVLYATYNVLIEEGIDYFDVSASAFTLSMTAVVLPVLLFVLRRGVDTRTWVSVIYVTAGIAIAMYPSFEHAQAPGIVIMIVSCILRAVFIVKLNDYAQEHEAVTLAAGLTFCSAAATFIPWCVMEPLTFMAMPWTAELIAVYVILGYFVVAFATVINIFAQRRATAVHSTIIYSTEIVFATIWATCLPSRIVDRVELTPAIVIGCMLVIVGSLVKIAPFGKGWEELVEEPSAAVSESIWHVHAKRMPDLVSALLLRIRFTFARNATLFVILLVVYLVISLPFKALAIIPGFTGQPAVVFDCRLHRQLRLSLFDVLVLDSDKKEAVQPAKQARGCVIHSFDPRLRLRRNADHYASGCADVPRGRRCGVRVVVCWELDHLPHRVCHTVHHLDSR